MQRPLYCVAWRTYWTRPRECNLLFPVNNLRAQQARLSEPHLFSSIATSLASLAEPTNRGMATRNRIVVVLRFDHKTYLDTSLHAFSTHSTNATQKKDKNFTKNETRLERTKLARFDPLSVDPQSAVQEVKKLSILHHPDLLALLVWPYLTFGTAFPILWPFKTIVR